MTAHGSLLICRGVSMILSDDYKVEKNQLRITSEDGLKFSVFSIYYKGFISWEKEKMIQCG